MCDTLVALSNSTKDGSVIFGKNSDRPDDEVQLITYFPRAQYPEDQELKCSYITIPQVKETVAIILSQPWWMWGAEMGANEYGVVIGNEAVHTYEPLRRTGLLGMDLLRLGLERGKTAIEALKVIAELLEKYHQGGGCAYGDSGWMYHNSFLITDNKEAYVLETADDWWLAEKVENVRSISNGISIRGLGSLRREGIIEYAIEKGYCKNEETFDFAVTFSGGAPSRSPYSRGGKSTLLLNENKGNITPSMMMEFLREHEAGICMHGSFESTGSQVSHLSNESIHWFTGTTLPCVSVYKPYVFPISEMNVLKPGPYSKIDPDWIWCKHSNYIHSFNFKKDDYLRKIKKIQEDMISRIIQESVNEENLSKKINSINNETWIKNKKILK